MDSVPFSVSPQMAHFLLFDLVSFLHMFCSSVFGVLSNLVLLLATVNNNGSILSDRSNDIFNRLLITSTEDGVPCGVSLET
jgi:hypothetical protein